VCLSGYLSFSSKTISSVSSPKLHPQIKTKLNQTDTGHIKLTSHSNSPTFVNVHTATRGHGMRGQISAQLTLASDPMRRTYTFIQSYVPCAYAAYFYCNSWVSCTDVLGMRASYSYRTRNLGHYPVDRERVHMYIVLRSVWTFSNKLQI
jgi:hypothetical protein